MKNKDITKTSLRALKQRYGKSNGKNREAEEELLRRGLNSKQLGEILWEHGQEQWRKQAKKSSKIRGARKAKKRSQKRKHWWNHIRKRRGPRSTTQSEGTTTQEPTVTPSASDGACPLEKERNADGVR